MAREPELSVLAVIESVVVSTFSSPLEERELGKEARDFLSALLPQGSRCWTFTELDITTFGRYVLEIELDDCTDVTFAGRSPHDGTSGVRIVIPIGGPKATVTGQDSSVIHRLLVLLGAGASTERSGLSVKSAAHPDCVRRRPLLKASIAGANDVWPKRRKRFEDSLSTGFAGEVYNHSDYDNDRVCTAHDL